ncbi:hypothetical protein B0H11DRAFT_2157280 [Mycena galericulata]|nr:hypothetical protein B0H11DRAFT_2157280 [Mycena galericulata]
MPTSSLTHFSQCPHRIPPRRRTEQFPLPFCTPQIATSFDSPFARGYNPALESIDISQEQLLAPPLRVVNFAGQVIGFIPYHWAMIAGAVMQTAAQTGMHVLSKTLTDRYLRAANLRLFKPRGLSVRLCTTAAMQHLVMRSGNGAGPSTLHKIGRGVGTVLLHAPIPFTSRIVRAIADKPPKVHASISTVGDGQKMPLATQRRLASLEGLNVPPPAKAQGVMDYDGLLGALPLTRGARGGRRIRSRRGAASLSASIRSCSRAGYAPSPQMGGPAFPRPQMGGGYPQAGPSSTYGLPLMGNYGYASPPQRERGGGGLISGLIGPKESRLERRVANADLLESWATDKVLWVVIMSAEIDKEIDGIERAESMDNEEKVDAKAWQTEIIKERDALEEEEDEEEEQEQEGQYGDQKWGTF